MGEEYYVGQEVVRKSDGSRGKIVRFRDMYAHPTMPGCWTRDYEIRFNGAVGVYPRWAFSAA